MIKQEPVGPAPCARLSASRVQRPEGSDGNQADAASGHVGHEKAARSLWASGWPACVIDTTGRVVLYTVDVCIYRYMVLRWRNERSLLVGRMPIFEIGMFHDHALSVPVFTFLREGMLGT